MTKRFFNSPWGPIIDQRPLDVPDVYQVRTKDAEGVYIPKKYFKFLSNSCVENFAYRPDMNAEGIWFEGSVAHTRAIMEIKSHVGLVNLEELAGSITVVLQKDLRFLQSSHPLAKEINILITRGNKEVIAAINDMQSHL